MRTTIGIILVVAALIGALTIVHAAMVGDQAVKVLKKQFDQEHPAEWDQATYDFFHSESAGYSEVLYFAPIYIIAYGAVGYLGCCIGVQGSKPRSSACVIMLTAILFTTLVWPWIAYGPSIDVVTRAVE